MTEADYYPPGAYNDPNAPYNQCDPEEREIDITTSISLSKSDVLSVDDYTVDAWEDWDSDEEGHTIHTGGIDYDYSSCDTSKAFKEQHLTIPELLEKLKEFTQEKIDRIETELRDFDPTPKVKANLNSEKTYLKYLLEEASGWEVDEEEITIDE